MSDKKRSEMGKLARGFAIENYSIESVCTKLESIIDNMPEVDWNFDFSNAKKDPDYIPDNNLPNSEWLIDIYKNILKLNVKEKEEGYEYWTKKLKEGTSREDILKYFKQVALEDNNKNNPTKFEDILDTEDEGRRLLISMPQSIGDVYLCTSLLKNIKEVYPNYNIYFATKPEYFEVLDGNPYVHKVIPYNKGLDNLTAMEGQAEHKGYFEIAFLPFIGTQRILNYMHNGKDKIQFDLCT
jgi:hypothetical protein